MGRTDWLRRAMGPGALEVIVDLALGSPHALRQERATRNRTVAVEGEPHGIFVEERHAHQRCDLEDRPDRDTRVALDLAERWRGDARATRQLLLRPLPVSAGHLDLRAEQLGGLDGVSRAGVSPRHSQIVTAFMALRQTISALSMQQQQARRHDLIEISQGVS